MPGPHRIARSASLPSSEALRAAARGVGTPGARSADAKPRAALYDDYVSFKRWDSPAPTTEDFATLLAPAPGLAGADLLDIGFGRGELLDWARDQGARTTGIEVIPELVDNARARRHHVLSALDTCSEPFDVITAIDVLEHLDIAQLVEMLEAVARLLKPEGIFIARFPNGLSPFARPYQYGDLTHRRFLTPDSLRQAAEPAGLRLVKSVNYRPRGHGLSRLKRNLAYLMRDGIETMLGIVYFGARLPMDPNLLVVLTRKQPPSLGA